MKADVLVSPALAIALVIAGCGDTEPANDAVSVSPDTPVASAPAKPASPAPTGPAARTPPLIRNGDPEKVVCTRPSDAPFDATSIVGQSLEQATARVERTGCSIRVIERDSVGLAVTEDFSPTRLNVAVTNDVVTRVDGLY